VPECPIPLAGILGHLAVSIPRLTRYHLLHCWRRIRITKIRTSRNVDQSHRFIAHIERMQFIAFVFRSPIAHLKGGLNQLSNGRREEGKETCPETRVKMISS